MNFLEGATLNDDLLHALFLVLCHGFSLLSKLIVYLGDLAEPKGPLDVLEIRGGVVIVQILHNALHVNHSAGLDLGDARVPQIVRT